MSEAIKVGDRVRRGYRNSDSTHDGICTNRKVITHGGVGIESYETVHFTVSSPTIDGGTFRMEADADEVELLEVAHYAPPGVPMVAMTPERTEALLYAYHVVVQQRGPAGHYANATERALRAMYEEARGEVKHV